MARPPAPAGATPAPDGTGFCTARDRPFLLAAAILASALGFIDGTVVAIALPAMRESLGAGLGAAQWIANAYMLALSALILAGGALGDRLGTARVFGGGIALFVAASLLCGLAASPGVLIAARALQGVGAAAMVPGSLALIARAYPEAERGRAIGIWAAASAVTTAGGPVLGGAILALGPEAWRAIFLVNLPLGGVALWLLLAHVARDRAAAAPAAVDWPGAALVTGGLGCIALALTASEHGGAPGPRDLALAAAGLGLLGLFLLVERRAPAPMLPLDVFARPGFAAVNAVTLTLYFALSTILFFLPMTVISGWGRPPLAAAFVFVPLSALIGALSPGFGRLAGRWGARRFIAGGAAVAGLGYLAMAAAAPAQAFWSGMVPAALLMGLGMALVVAPLSTAVMASAGAGRAGVASGVNNAVSRTAGLLAVAAMGPVAATAYGAAGGPASFGAAAAAEAARGHGTAMSAAFSTLAAISALLAFASAALAWTGLRRI